jgi:hypothetical protein
MRPLGGGEPTHPAMRITYLVILLWAVWSWVRPVGP